MRSFQRRGGVKGKASCEQAKAEAGTDQVKSAKSDITDLLCRNENAIRPKGKEGKKEGVLFTRTLGKRGMAMCRLRGVFVMEHAMGALKDEQASESGTMSSETILDGCCYPMV